MTVQHTLQTVSLICGAEGAVAVCDGVQHSLQVRKWYQCYTVQKETITKWLWKMISSSFKDLCKSGIWICIQTLWYVITDLPSTCCWFAWHLNMKMKNKISEPCNHLCAGTRWWWTSTSSRSPLQTRQVCLGSELQAQVSLSASREEKQLEQRLCSEPHSDVCIIKSSKGVQKMMFWLCPIMTDYCTCFSILNSFRMISNCRSVLWGATCI